MKMLRGEKYKAKQKTILCNLSGQYIKKYILINEC